MGTIECGEGTPYFKSHSVSRQGPASGLAGPLIQPLHLELPLAFQTASPRTGAKSKSFFLCWHFPCFKFNLYPRAPSLKCHVWAVRRSAKLVWLWSPIVALCSGLDDLETRWNTPAGWIQRVWEQVWEDHWVELTFWSTMSTFEKLTPSLRFSPHFEELVIAWELSQCL